MSGFLRPVPTALTEIEDDLLAGLSAGQFPAWVTGEHTMPTATSAYSIIPGEPEETFENWSEYVKTRDDAGVGIDRDPQLGFSFTQALQNPASDDSEPFGDAVPQSVCAACREWYANEHPKFDVTQVDDLQAAQDRLPPMGELGYFRGFYLSISRTATEVTDVSVSAVYSNEPLHYGYDAHGRKQEYTYPVFDEDGTRVDTVSEIECL